jgi:hypothetical protein
MEVISKRPDVEGAHIEYGGCRSQDLTQHLQIKESTSKERSYV